MYQHDNLTQRKEDMSEEMVMAHKHVGVGFVS